MECILQEIESSKEAVVLKRFDFSYIKMTEIRAETLKSLSRLEEFSTNYKAKLTSAQLRTIFTEIIERKEENKLKVLRLPGNRLSELRPHLVAAAMEKLVTIDVEATHISDLAREIFRKERVFFNFDLGIKNKKKILHPFFRCNF